MDIMLDLPEMMALGQAARERLVAQRLATEVPAVISTYKTEDFDSARLLADFEKWIRRRDATR
jgi:hypothetical protein